MTLLTTADHVTSDDSSAVDEKLECSEHHRSNVSDQPECVERNDCFDDGVSQVDKADLSENSQDCGVLTAFSDLEGDGASSKTGKWEVSLEKRETVLNNVGEGGQCLEETRQGVKSSERRETPEDVAKEGMEVDDPVTHNMDGGWAYMVLVGSFTIMVVVATVGPGFGILFSDFFLEMNATSTLATAIFNSEAFTWSVSNLLAGPVVEQFGLRAVGMVGGMFCCLGMLASAFAPAPSFLFFSHAILSGFGSGMSCLVAFAVIPQYFNRMLGRANGIMASGMSIGGMIGAPVVTYLQENFGFRGATLIVAAFTLHISVAAALFRPVQKASKVEESTASRLGLCKLMVKMVCSLGKNCLLLRSPRVIIIAVGSSFVVIVFLNFYMLVPFVLRAKGHTVEMAAWCMSIVNISTLAARLVASACSDMAWFSALYGYIAFAILLGFAMIVFGFVQEIMWITVALSVCGICLGACMTLQQMIMVRYMSSHLYLATLGVVGFTNGVGMLCSGPLIGAIRDWTGSYAASMCALGVSAFVAAILFLLLPLAVAYDKRKEEQQRGRDAEVGG